MFFAVSMMVFGIQQFIYAKGGIGLEFISPRISGHTSLAYMSGALLYLCGMKIALKSRARIAAMLLAIFFFCCVLLLHTTELLFNLHDLVERTTAFETLALCAGAMILSGTLPAENLNSLRWLCFAQKMKALGRYFLTLSMAIFGWDHLMATHYVATLIPLWIPWHLFWVYFTAFGMMGGSLAFLIQKKDGPLETLRYAAPLLGLMFFLWVVFLHIPRVVLHLHNGNEWNSAFVALAMSGCTLMLWKPRAKKQIKTKSEVNYMKAFATLVILAYFASAQLGYGAESPTPSASPVLVELFTSEGCSSCPPADSFLQTLDSTQPVPGAQLIVLSEHVDYFNSEGWKDPYSSSLFTNRQKDYDSSMGIGGPYTPQIIVDGTDTLHLDNQQQMLQVFRKAVTNSALPIQISTVTVQATTPGSVHAHINIDGSSSKQNADIYVAVALNQAESQVLKGENQGKHLTHVAVVQELIKAGKLQKGKVFSKDVAIALKPGADAGNIRIVVIVQKSGPGKVLGAALWKG